MALVPLDSTRYARFHVPRRCSIREYVASLGVKFLPGRSYYELTKKEDVSDAKEVVVETLADGVLFGGDGAKNLVTRGRGGTLKLGPEDVPAGHRVYVQVGAPQCTPGFP